jgi:hypothetical protein
VSRVFAPVYRQTTLTALVGALGGGDPAGEEARAVAYGDVVDAFKHYIANDNRGRGFVLVGHSQGAGHLAALVAAEIDGEPRLRDRLLSAMLLGASVRVPEGEIVGGDFDNVPLCTAADDLGCVVSYASFRSTSPPPPNSFFGRPRGGEGEAACTNPAALGGGSGPLQPYLPTDGASLPSADGPPPVRPPWLADPQRNAAIATKFVTLPGMVDAQCARRDGFSYLELTVHGDPGDGRIDDIGGDLTPEWGMHLVDVSVAMGNLVDVVEAQAAAFESSG